MNESLFIYNERSGSCDPALVAEIEQLFERSGWPLGSVRAMGDQPLPDARSLRAERVGLAVVLSGDGSLSAVAQALDGWDGTLLALPGGTMNLLAHALHGDLDALEVVQAYLDGRGSVLRTPIIRAGSIAAYTGLIAGPTAAWGEVREALRNRDIAALAEEVPNALSATFEHPGVALEGDDTVYPAIFVEPGVKGLRAYGVLASGAGDLFRHGWAWLAGDFRDGPSEPLGLSPTISLRTEARSLDLLVDGEKAEAGNALELHIARSGVRFFAAQGETAWR